jgi:hypothetical protein
MGTTDPTDMGTDTGKDAGDDVGRDAGQDMGASPCTEQPNEGSPPTDTCQHGGAGWIAWKWVAPRDMSVDEIQIHTDEGNGALLADDGDSPGAELFSGPLSDPDNGGWRTFSADASVPVVQGTTYWIGEDVTFCSTVEDGDEPAYYTADVLTGPWSGPYTAHPFTARIAGTCR